MDGGAVVLAGGGTGGHVFPSLAVAAALAEARPGLDICFVGTARGLEARLVPEAGWRLDTVEVLPLRRRLSADTLRVPASLARATRDVARLLRARGAVAAVAFGGYVSLPLALAAWRTRTPLVVHEQNAIPGLANRIAVRGAAAVAATFPSSVARFGGARAVEVTGNPIRPSLAVSDPAERAALRGEALAAFGLETDRRTLLVFGGSQGARRINQAVVAAASRWARPGQLQLLHATGHAGYDETQRAWDSAAADASTSLPLVRCVEFCDRMDLAYAAADVVVARAGASTIAELTALGLPSLLVPYPHATADHQTVNARDLAALGGAEVVADADLDAATLVAGVEPLLTDLDLHAAMAAAARGFGRPDAAERVAALVLAVARPAAPSVRTRAVH